MTRAQCSDVARRAGLGAVHYQVKVASNTRQTFEVGHVVQGGAPVLFCKRQPHAGEADFYLCNEFASLTPREDCADCGEPITGRVVHFMGTSARCEACHAKRGE